VTIEELIAQVKVESKKAGFTQSALLLSADLNGQFFSSAKRQGGVRLDSLIQLCRPISFGLFVGDTPIRSHKEAIDFIQLHRRIADLSHKELAYKAGYHDQHLPSIVARGGIRLQAFINYLQVFGLELTIGPIK